MSTSRWILSISLAGCIGMSGCDSSTDDSETAAPGADSESPQEYPITGEVVSISDDRTTVTIDHEDIPDLMPGMEMQFDVEDPQILEGIEVGDDVNGRLQVSDGEYVIRELQQSQ